VHRKLRFSERGKMNSPMPRAWIRVTERIAKTMRSRWLAWTAFVFWSAVDTAQSELLGSQFSTADKLLGFSVIFKRCETVRFDFRVLFAYNHLRFSRLQIGDQKLLLAEWFSTQTLCIHSVARGYIAVRFREN
jgi:hypothetical protein